jgi:hypothetical protein
MTMDTIKTATLKELQNSHFVRLARRKHPGASSGEKRSRRLALALLDNLPGLDDEAIDGMIGFADLVKRAPETARSLVDGWPE